jgi:hypothetical protein
MTTKLPILPEEKPWYSEGLRFECTGCGQCCTGSPGYVWVTEEEIQKIADFLSISLQNFATLYLRKIDGRWSLRELRHTYDCVFLKDNKCSIYTLRPTQCKTFPWWPRNLQSRSDWIEAAKHCEGISHNASLVPYEIIQEQLEIQEKK